MQASSSTARRAPRAERSGNPNPPQLSGGLPVFGKNTVYDAAPERMDEPLKMLLAAMFAGHRTSSVTTAWALLEWMQNPACRRNPMAGEA